MIFVNDLVRNIIFNKKHLLRIHYLLYYLLNYNKFLKNFVLSKFGVLLDQ